MRPLEPDLLAVEDRLVLVDPPREVVDELAALCEEAWRDVLGETARLEVARVHADAGDELEEVEHGVALAEAVPEHRNGADLECARAEPDEVRVDAVELAEEHPHPRRLLRGLHLEELLDGEDEDELVVLERQVVDPLRVRDRLPPRLLLHVLLEPGVEIADDGLEAFDLLAVQIDDQAQHAVRGGMVRPEVDLKDVPLLAEGGIDLEDGRDGRGDPRSLRRSSPALARRQPRAHSALEKRTGSPPSG